MTEAVTTGPQLPHGKEVLDYNQKVRRTFSTRGNFLLRLVFLLSAFLSYQGFAETLNVNGFAITAEVVNDTLPVKVKNKNKNVLNIFMEVKGGPQIKKLETFQSGRDTYVLLDYKMGLEFGPQFEKTCFKVMLWKLEKTGNLKIKEQNIYNCEINSYNEEIKAKEFYRPYILNKEKAKLEYNKR